MYEQLREPMGVSVLLVHGEERASMAAFCCCTPQTLTLMKEFQTSNIIYVQSHICQFITLKSTNGRSNLGILRGTMWAIELSRRYYTLGIWVFWHVAWFETEMLEPIISWDLVPSWQGSTNQWLDDIKVAALYWQKNATPYFLRIIKI